MKRATRYRIRRFRNHGRPTLLKLQRISFLEGQLSFAKNPNKSVREIENELDELEGKRRGVIAEGI